MFHHGYMSGPNDQHRRLVCDFHDARIEPLIECKAKGSMVEFSNTSVSVSILNYKPRGSMKDSVTRRRRAFKHGSQ